MHAGYIMQSYLITVTRRPNLGTSNQAALGSYIYALATCKSNLRADKYTLTGRCGESNHVKNDWGRNEYPE